MSGRRHERPPASFLHFDLFIVVDRDDQAAAKFFSGGQISDMPDVNEVETAVRQNDRTARRTLLGGVCGDLFPR